MIVRCPICATNYQVDARALGPSGRTVRCAHCSHTWRQAPAEELVSAEAVPAPAVLPESAPAVAPELPRRTAPPQQEFVEQPPRLHQDAVAGESAHEPEVRRRRRPMVAAGWLLLLLVIAALAGGAVWKREDVIAFWPPALRLYVALGLEKPPPADGLVIEHLKPRRDEQNGVPRLVIEGEVVNSATVALAVPPLKVELKDAGQRVVQTWTFSASTDRLLPGASVPFSTSVERPNETATDMRVSFVDEEHP